MGLSSAGCACTVRSLPRDFAVCRGAYRQCGCGKGRRAPPRREWPHRPNSGRVPAGGPDATAGKTIPCRPKGTVCPARLATTGKERSIGSPAPIGAPWPKDRGCNGFQRGAGDLENGQSFDNLHPALSCRSHSFKRTRVRLFADEAFMIR